jgi:hypothetical protein
VVDALRCAVEVQRGMAERNAAVPPNNRIEFCIGIKVGDVVVEDGANFGDGVNVAARLEGLAEPGGICVSARVQEDAAGKLDLAIKRSRTFREDAVFYGGRPGHAVGHAKVREYFDSYVGTLAAARLALVDQELRKLGEGVYLAQGYGAFDFDLTSGCATRTALRSTLVLTRRPEGWRIAQHHFSSPPPEPPIPAPKAAQS